MENKILAATAASRDAFASVREYISPDSMTPAGSIILKTITEYYDRDRDATSCDLEVVRELAAGKVTSGAARDQVLHTIGMIEELDISTANVVTQVLEKRRIDVGQELTQAILTDKPAYIRAKLLEEYNTLIHAEELDVSTADEIVAPDLVSLIQDNLSEDRLIPIAPKSLNDRLGGGVNRGRVIFGAARPEVGKTALCVNASCAAAMRGFRVFYYANEEPIVDVIMRHVSNLSGMNSKHIKENPAKAQEIAESRGLGNIIFVYADRNTPWEVRALAKKHRPDLLVVDQVRNLNMRCDGMTELLERAGKALREIAASCDCVVLGITQAGDSAQGKAILSMSDIDSSKTGFQGACDVLVLMGMSPDLEAQGRRCITLAKNKVSGDHTSFYVNIDASLSRINDG